MIVKVNNKEILYNRDKMRKNKDINIILDTYGNYLGMEKGCIVLRDKKGNESRYPLVEDTIGEIVLNS